MQSTPDRPSWLELPEIESPWGTLCYAQNDDSLPFTLARTYFVRDIPAAAARGGHSHRRNREVVFCIHGACTLWLYDREGRELRFRLEQPRRGAYVPPGWWVELGDYSEAAMTLVMASQNYDEADYIRDPEEFFHAAPYPDPVYRPRP
ncbi:sugar 3,4-ketoisomerase [Geothermobacter hydrogeniphilus]|nr:FdtA/QdtA family cupin domain-containing protein [Geothermobacter hydrogeniphilus]